LEKEKHTSNTEMTDDEKAEQKLREAKEAAHAKKMAKYAVDKPREAFTHTEDYILHFLKVSTYLSYSLFIMIMPFRVSFD
jgi:hypothetical protein